MQNEVLPVLRGENGGESGMNRLSSQEIIKVTNALIGKTTAVGDSRADEMIMKNLKVAIDLTNWLLDGIADSARTRHNYNDSMRNVGETAFSSMCEWKDFIETTINDR